MDEAHRDEFRREEMPNRVHLSTSCCEINCGGQADIAIIIQHTKPPKDQPMTSWPTSASAPRSSPAARSPRSARRWSTVPPEGRREEVHLAAVRCYPPQPADADQRSRALQVRDLAGGKNSNARAKPTFMKMVAAASRNNPPRWPEVSEIVKKILYTSKGEDARPWERLSDWVERIGWPRFEKTGLPFTKYLIDDWRRARVNLNASAHIRF